ncbi:MAG: MerR family transcriptional regulator [Flavobacteriales bacterium]|nr:MerR family transcriptional regulator [Flavobacteriales bacterium]
MAKYSIKEIESLTGIKAHTIRIWEKRYNIISPERTSTNIRLYSDGDIKRILNVSILNHHGLKISKISDLSNDEINNKVLQLTLHCKEEDRFVDMLVACMVELDELRFEKIVSNSIFKIGFEETISNVIYPLLDRIGVLWQTGSISAAQEHFMSNLIRQKLIAAIDGLPPCEKKERNQYLLFLPEGEQHEIGLLFYYYLLKKNGKYVIYLGQSVPLNDVIEIAETRTPPFLLTAFVCSQNSIDVLSYLQELEKIKNVEKIYITGAFANQSAHISHKTELISNIKQFCTYILV